VSYSHAHPLRSKILPKIFYAGQNFNPTRALVQFKLGIRHTGGQGAECRRSLQRLPDAYFVFRFDFGANDLFGRDAIHLFRPGPHELDAATGDNKGLETVRAKIGEQFEHRLIDALGSLWLPIFDHFSLATPSGEFRGSVSDGLE
jgi:hypothetical protein